MRLTIVSRMQKLVQAAREGRLLSKEDYRREVVRLLNDKQSFYDEVDPTLNGIHLRSHKVTHPKINRFFREFFGYPNSVKLFKDVARSGGFYDNAGRDYTGTAGSVTNEADRVVDHILNQDQDVFARLLTTDRFFVLHTKSNEEGQKIVAGWRRAYDGLKDTDWKENTEQALLENFEEHKDLFAQIRITDLREDRRKHHVRDFERFMSFFEHTFGKGRDADHVPVVFSWWAEIQILRNLQPAACTRRRADRVPGQMVPRQIRSRRNLGLPSRSAVSSSASQGHSDSSRVVARSFPEHGDGSGSPRPVDS